MLLSEKYEEIYPSPCRTYVKASDNAFSQDKLKLAESMVAKNLMFKFETFPTPCIFLKRFEFIIKLKDYEHSFALFMLQLMLYHYEALQVKPSMQAICAIVITKLCYGDDKTPENAITNIGREPISNCLKLDTPSEKDTSK